MDQSSLDNLVGLIGVKGTLALATIYFVNWLKNSKYFPWINNQTKNINHLVATAISIASGLGITFEFNHDTHALIIGGLSWVAIKAAGESCLQQYLATKVGYHLLQDRINPQPVMQTVKVGAVEVTKPVSPYDVK